MKIRGDEITKLTDDISERTTYEALMGSGPPTATGATMTTMSIFVGVLTAIGIAYIATTVLEAHPEAGAPMAIGAALGFIPSIALVARAKSDIFDWMLRISLCPIIGLAIGFLVGVGL